MSKDFAITHKTKQRTFRYWLMILAGMMLVFSSLSLYIHFRQLQPTSTTQHAPVDMQSTSNDALVTQKPIKPRFEFYTILPDIEVSEPISVAKPTMNIKLEKKESTNEAQKGNYLLQVASFRREEDASKLKDALTHLGFKPGVSKAEVQHNIWHRVMLGPFDNKQSAEDTRAKLLKFRYKSLLLTLEDKA